MMFELEGEEVGSMTLEKILGLTKSKVSPFEYSLAKNGQNST